MPLNLEPLDNNPWLAGFLDGDGHFSVRATAPASRLPPPEWMGGNEKRKHHIVECRLELAGYCQRIAQKIACRGA